MFKTLKYFLISYLIIIVTLAFIQILRGGELEPLIWLLVIIALVVIVGLFIGMIISAIAQKPHKENTFYLIGQITPLAVFMVFAIYSRENRIILSNGEENEKTIKSLTLDSTTSTSKYIREAFKKLKREFKDSNDFIIKSYTVYIADTLINYRVDSVYTIYFCYSLKQELKKEFYSKWKVFQANVELELLNIETNTNIEYQKVRKKQVMFPNIRY